MDELKEIWKNLKKETNELTDFSASEIKNSINQKSKGIMKTLRHKVLQKLLFCIFFTLVLGILIPFADPLPSKVLLLILLGAYLMGDILLWQEYKELGKHVDVTQDLMENMLITRDRIKNVIKYEQLVGLALYPISLTAGFMMGLTAGEENPTYMDRQLDWVALVIAILVFTPLCHWLAKYLNTVAFGKYLDKLERNIVELQKIEG